jgi:hypothetical protein
MWTNDTEISFFESELKSLDVSKLFYCLGMADYFAYIPKNSKEKRPTLQSRNAPIGKFTERWVRDLLEKKKKKHGLFAVSTVECRELGLVKRSEADVAFCTTNTRFQKPEHIKIIFEVKMSVVSNYRYDNHNVTFFGDHTTHKGTPSLLRSDSMLKATGKAIYIRVSGLEASTIPIVVLGNSPISKGHEHKVDFLKNTGVIQSFLSLSPQQPVGKKQIQQSKNLGFQTIHDEKALQKIMDDMLSSEATYFSSMMPIPKLGELISIANKEKTDVAKAEKFLSFIRDMK